MLQIRRALISVSDKTGLDALARYLNASGVELISTGGTADFIRNLGIPVVQVSDYSGFPEILGGRVKTLHPKIHSGILASREDAVHQQQMRDHGFENIDMVVVNFYPFREAAAIDGAPFHEVIESIDIGGPSMVRAAAKNSAYVAVVTDPRDYGWILEELKSHDCSLGDATRFILAQEAFAATAQYESEIAAWFARHVWSGGKPEKVETSALPALEVLSLEKIKDLRYGENPHQRAALYRRLGHPVTGVTGAEFLHGKELSYNNLLDADAAWNLVLEFDRTAAAIIKHSNPSGTAVSDSQKDAYAMARECDPVSAYGSIVAFNRKVEADTAGEIASTFVEVVLAPEFSEEALEILKRKKNLRLLRMGMKPSSNLEHRQIGGGFLVQDRDVYHLDPENLKVVTRRKPTEEEMQALLFGWHVVKYVKSNAIVFCDAHRTLGIGAGQMSRVDSVRWGAERAVLPLEGCAMASDAYFPFPDGVQEAASHGVRAVIQPGGSIRDGQVIQAAEELDLAMVFTGIRHFRH